MVALTGIEGVKGGVTSVRVGLGGTNCVQVVHPLRPKNETILARRHSVVTLELLTLLAQRQWLRPTFELDPTSLGGYCVCYPATANLRHLIGHH